MSGFLSGRLRGTALLATVLLAASTLSACGHSGGASGAPAELTSSATTPWKLVTYQGAKYAVGHGVEFKVPDSWGDYGAEFTGQLGDTYEWAVGLPANAPEPADVQISMGIPGKGSPYDSLTHSAVAEAQLVAPGHKLISQGDTTVKGASRAYDFRFQHQLTLNGKSIEVEQLTLLIDMGNDVAATLRFISTPGAWHQQFDSVYQSVTVAQGPDDGASA